MFPSGLVVGSGSCLAGGSVASYIGGIPFIIVKGIAFLSPLFSGVCFARFLVGSGSGGNSPPWGTALGLSGLSSLLE